MEDILIQNARIVNEGAVKEADLLIKKGRIWKIGKEISATTAKKINAKGRYLLPGVIDDQVHFREPGLTHKADIATESRAAVAGGITSFMEMPNTIPQTLTQELLEKKYERAAATSMANYSFYMGASNDNLEEVLRTDAARVCGVKVFMGSSTGNMLVDDRAVLEKLFREVPMLIATHCEKEEIVRANLKAYKEKYGEEIPFALHPEIRSVEACYASSSEAVALAKKYGTRLHVLHLSTAKEMELFHADKPLAEKRITAEACIHHLFFSDEDYTQLRSRIKWNPAVKSVADREAIWEALLQDKIDVIATDHAPHTLEEKSANYFGAPSGGPLVQHALPVMLSFWKQGKISLPRLVEKMSHAPAICFRLKERGFIREGYYADLVLIDENQPLHISPENILYKCGWSPFEGMRFPVSVTHTFVSGQLAWQEGKLNESVRGKRLEFSLP